MLIIFVMILVHQFLTGDPRDGHEEIEEFDDQVEDPEAFGYREIYAVPDLENGEEDYLAAWSEVLRR